ncbi:GGDEF domain-containing protein [Clostridioides difficile]
MVDEKELRFRKGKDKYIWCKVRLSRIIDKYSQCTRVIGVVVDIDKEKRKNEELKNRAQKDLLTGLYNKITAEDLVREYIENEGKNLKSALFIIDIDDFKGINDNLGHLFGEEVLNDISSKFINIFRADDNLYCSNTFEWCNDGIAPEISNLKKVSYNLFDYYKQNFNDRGIFYCKDISSLDDGLYKILKVQGIVSMLQCAILDEGDFSGYVGFDECNENRFCTKEEIESLTFINVWTSANASYIEWNEEKSACLMCCNDITKYKEDESKSEPNC